MTKRIVAFSRLKQAQLDQLRREFHVDYFEHLESIDNTAFREALKSAHGLIGSSLKIPASLLDAAPSWRPSPPFRWVMTTIRSRK